MSRFGRSIAATLGHQALASVIALGVTLLIARTLGPAGIGLYAVASLVPILMTMVLQLGISQATVYYVAGRQMSVGDARRTVVVLWVVISIGGCLLGGAGVTVLGPLLSSVPQELLLAGVALFPVFLLQPLLAGIILGTQAFVTYNRAMVLAPSITLALAAVLLVPLQAGVAGALLALAGGQIVASAVLWRAVAARSAGSPWPSAVAVRQLLGYGWRVQANTVVAYLNYRSGIVLITYFLGPASAGVYVLAVQVAERIMMLSQATKTIAFPRLSELAAAAEQVRRELTPRLGRLVLLTMAGSALVIVVIARPFIELLFGAAFAGAYLALLWLLPGVVCLGLARVLGTDLSARGRPELNLVAGILALILNVIGNLVLIPTRGIEGAAIASMLAYALSAAITLTLYARLSGNAWWRPLRVEADDLRTLRGSLLDLARRRSSGGQL